MSPAGQTDVTDYEAQPERYPLDMDDEQALDIAPYANRLLPYWRYGTNSEAALSAAQLYEWVMRYKEAGDFVGMDVARRLLRLGMTRARQTHPAQTFNPAGPMQPTAAAIFSKTFHMVNNDPDFAILRQAHAERSAQ